MSGHKIVKIVFAYQFNRLFTSLRINETSKPLSPLIGNDFNSLNFNEANFDLISKDLELVDQNDINVNCSEGEFTSKFYSIVFEICLKHTPLKSIKRSCLNNYHTINRKGKPYSAKTKRRTVARILVLKQHFPNSPNIAKLELKLKSFEDDRKNTGNILQMKKNKKKKREIRAIRNIKRNPKFFYSYAKKNCKVQKQN